MSSAYISLLREIKYAFRSACFISRSHSGIILHPSALLALKYVDITRSSRTEWIAKYMLTLVIWHCCSLQTRPLRSLCNGSSASALLEAPLELTFWNWVYNGQCWTLILRSFWENKALIGCQSKLTFCFVLRPSSGGCNRIQQLLAYTCRHLYVSEPNLQVSVKETEGNTVKITGEEVRGPIMLHTFLSFSSIIICWLYKLTISEHSATQESICPI